MSITNNVNNSPEDNVSCMSHFITGGSGDSTVVVVGTPPHVANMRVLICPSTTQVLLFSQQLIIASLMTDVSFCQRRRSHA